MHLLIGLGNPGAKYAGNRHNIGFLALDAIAETYRFKPWSSKFNGQLSEGQIKEEKTLLFKPLTYMNNSGQAADELARFYKISPASITVFHDELDLPLAKIRVKTGGGHGGHNGLKSLDSHIGQEYRRVRIGIGHPGIKEMVHSHVLSDFSKAEMTVIGKMLPSISDALPLLLANDAAGFMNKITLMTKESKDGL